MGEGENLSATVHLDYLLCSREIAGEILLGARQFQKPGGCISVWQIYRSGAKHDRSKYEIITQYGSLKTLLGVKHDEKSTLRLLRSSLRTILSKPYWIITNNLYAVMLRPLQK